MLNFHNYCFRDIYYFCRKVRFKFQTKTFVFIYNGIALIDIADVFC